jgi:NADH:ubiquinone oxidoreductase subunit 6 (subunit J)
MSQTSVFLLFLFVETTADDNKKKKKKEIKRLSSWHIYLCILLTLLVFLAIILDIFALFYIDKTRTTTESKNIFICFQNQGLSLRRFLLIIELIHIKMIENIQRGFYVDMLVGKLKFFLSCEFCNNT